MVKYTVTEEMTLPELIEWAWENDVKNKYFYGGERYADEVYFDGNGAFHLKSYFITKSQTFSVEVEKEINEKIVVPHLIECARVAERENFYHHENKSINLMEDELSKAFYILNDDHSLTLLWKDGEMVE